MDETKIRAELAETVAKDPNNIDKILKLSHELASLDKNNCPVFSRLWRN